MFRVAVLSLTLPVLASGVAWSQEPSTREEADRQRREQKAKEVKPYEPKGLERALDFAEEKAIFILDREGFHPKLGSLTTGSGFAYGLGFRDRDLFSNTGALEIWAAGSVKRYWATEARLRFPRLADNHLYLETWASHRDYPQENFFGLGPDSDRDDRSDYAIRTNHFGGRAGVRPLSHLLVGGGIEYLEPRLGSGKNDQFPDVDRCVQPVRGARPRRPRRFPAIRCVHRGRLSRAAKSEEGRLVSGRLLALRRSHRSASSRSTASMPTCASSSVFWRAVA